jgi:hypothetical protein
MIWAELPNSRRHKSSNPHRHADIMKLKTNPGVWAELSLHANPKAARQVVLRLRKRHNGDRYASAPFEFTSRVYRPSDWPEGHPPQAKVYGRWIGNPHGEVHDTDMSETDRIRNAVWPDNGV